MSIKHVLYVMLFFIVLAYSASGVLTYLYNGPCRNLNRIASDRDLVSRIWNIVSFYYKDPEYLKASLLYKSKGLFYINEMEANLGSDTEWEEIGINPTLVTLDIVGSDIDYSYINVDQVEEIKVGFGMRFQIVYKLADHPGHLSHNNYKDASYEVSVECSEE